MGWQNPVAKCLLKECESFFEGPMLCKRVRAKLACPPMPAKFKPSSVCHLKRPENLKFEEQKFCHLICSKFLELVKFQECHF